MKQIRKFTQYILLAFAAIVATTIDSIAHFGERSPTGGNVTALVVESNYNVVYLGTKNGGAYYLATTTATSWSRRNTAGLASGNITAITSVGNTITGLYIIAGTSDSGIFVSSDRGATWTSTTIGLTNNHITALVTAGSLVIAGTSSSGIFVSSNNGSSFTAATIQPASLAITSLAVDGSTLYAGTYDKGVFKSTDNGTTWTEINAGVLSSAWIGSLAVYGTTLIAGTKEGIYIATTTSVNWVAANTGLTNTTITSFASDGANWYAGSNGGVFSTSDNGANWAYFDAGFDGAVQALAFHSGNLYIGTATDGVYRKPATTTTTGVKFNTGLYNLNTYAIYNSGTLVVVANEKGVFVSTNYGVATGYVTANTGLTDYLNVADFAFSGTKLYAGTKNDGVFVTADTGKTWTAANTGLPSGISVNKLIATNTSLIATLANGNVYSSPLASINWSQGIGLASNLSLSALATDGINAFVGTRGNGVYISTDAQNWKEFNTGLTNQTVTSLAINSTYVYAGTPGNGVFKSSVLNCSAWAAIATTLPSLNITSMASGGKWIVAGYKGGVIASTDNGVTWQSPTNLWIPDYANVTGISMSAATSTDRIYAVAPANAVYANAISELSGYSTAPGSNLIAVNTVTNSCIETGTTTGINDATADYGIRVYPNPNAGTFNISIAEDLAGTISETGIYDYTGKLIQSFALSRSTTIHTNYPRGIYFIRFTVAPQTIIKKLAIE